MAAERLPPDDPREWLNRARSNLARARAHLDIPEVYLEDLCFDTQQAAEKAIKAVLILLGVSFPYVHDLGELLSLVERSGETVPEAIWEADQLTPYAVTLRYPGLEPISREEYEKAVAIAEAVLRWAEEHLRGKPE